MIVAAALSAGCANAGADGLSAEESRNKEIILEVFKALETDDLAMLERYFAVDGDFVIGLERRKRGGPYATFQEAAPYPGALDKVQIDVERIIAEGDSVAIQSMICGDHAVEIQGFAPTGKRLCGRYLNFYVLKDGMIVNNTVGVHRDQLRAQLEANAAAETGSGN